jgi:hypothetical protein
MTSTFRSRFRRPLRITVVGVAVALGAITVFSVRPLHSSSPDTVVTAATPIVTQISNDDAGDELATTTYKGPMIRYRVAIAVHVLDNTNTGLDTKLTHTKQQMIANAPAEQIGALTEANFAVFSPTLLNYLVPNLTMVLPEGATLQDGERLMRNHSYPYVGFYFVDSVQVHDIAFTVSTPHPRQTSAYVDREGVLTDSLGKYTTTMQPHSVTFSYFGAVLSDSQILSDRAAVARAAAVSSNAVTVYPVIRTSSVPITPTPQHHH